MSFGIGLLELAVILLCAIVAFAAYFRRMPQLRWYKVVLGCVILASVLTPADLFSMLIMAVAFIAVYYGGTRHGTITSTATA